MGQNTNSLVRELANKVGEKLGYEVVDISFAKEGPNRVLRVLIDHPNGIGISDCEKYSHYFSDVLDSEDPISSSYMLEVSSPGIDRPLTKPEHFLRFTGETIELRLFSVYEGRKKFIGRLQGWAEEDNGKVLMSIEEKNMAIPWSLVSKARIVFED